MNVNQRAAISISRNRALRSQKSHFPFAKCRKFILHFCRFDAISPEAVKQLTSILFSVLVVWMQVAPITIAVQRHTANSCAAAVQLKQTCPMFLVHCSKTWEQ